MQTIDLLRNMMMMAYADGVLKPLELELLDDRRQAWGISQADFDRALRQARSPSAELVLPAHPHQRHDLLGDLVTMMAVDGHCSDEEKQLLALAAAKLEIAPQALAELIEEFTDADDDLVLDD